MKNQNSDNSRNTEIVAVAFDFDNTLFDYNKTEKIALITVFNKFNIPFKDSYYDLFRMINHKLWEETENKDDYCKQKLRIDRFEELFQKIGYNDQCKNAEIASDFFLESSRTGVLIDGVYNTLLELKKQGLTLIIGSAGLSDPRKFKLLNSGLIDVFDYVFFREDFPKSGIKPNISFFTTICNVIPDATPDKIVYVGDTFDSDIKGSKQAGFSNIWFNFFKIDESTVEMKYCDNIIYCFKDILCVLRTLEKEKNNDI